VNETTIVISKSSESTLDKCFKNETIEQKIDGLASITLQLPEANNQIYGVYYFLFKSLAEWGINVEEVISTTNEVSIIVADSDIERTFSVLNRLKK
jgi:aspartokinase